MVIHAKDNELQELLATSQVVTGAWVDLSANTIDVKDMQSIALFMKIDINDCTDFRVRMVALSGADVYVLPIRTTAATKVVVSPEYYELTDDADQNIILDFPILDCIELVKFQISAGTAGTTGAITSAKVAFNEKESCHA